MALLIAQTVLAARGRIRAHRALSTFGIGYDWIQQRRVYLVYVIGVIAMAASLVRLSLGTNETWMAIGRPIIEAIA